MSYGATLTQLSPGIRYKAVVPQKVPIGGSVKGTMKPGLFKVYVPARDGPTLEVKTTAGTVAVHFPNGAPAVDAKGKPVGAAATVKFDVPQGQVGWFGVIVRDSASYEVSAKLSYSGNSRDADGSLLAPWNFFYFPFTKVEEEGKNHPSAKWQAKFGGGANDWEKTSYWKSAIDSNGQKGSGYAGHGITKATVDEYNKWAGKQVVDFANTWWWGHCDAAATASAVFAQPKAGNGFTEADIEYFATEIAMRGYEIELKFFLGGLTNNNRQHPSHTEKPEDRPGQAVDLDAGNFHETLIDVVRNKGAVGLCDFRADWAEGKNQSPDVWNQAIYKFTMEGRQSKKDASLAEEENNAKMLDWKTIICANADSSDSGGNPESPAGSGWDRENHYVLNYDGTGKVVLNHPSNNWRKTTWERTGKEYYAPRYIFQIKGINPARAGPGNPHISLDKAKTIGLQLRKLFGG